MAFRTLPVLTAALLLSAPSARPQSSAFSDRAKPRLATVSILALSSSAHTGFAGNEDIYLADASFKEGDHANVRLLDLYPAIGNPIRRTLIADRRLFQMRLLRAPECDMAAHDVLVATPDENIFDATTRATFSGPATQIPCYKVVHEATRLVKK